MKKNISEDDIDLLFSDVSLKIPKPNNSDIRKSQNTIKSNDLLDTFECADNLKNITPLNTKYHDRIESSFVWNLNSVSKFFKLSSFDESCYTFFPPVIQGHVEQIYIDKKNLKEKIILISRRSYIMGGTRYNSRGINPSGFVSNYVETEQIIDFKKKVYSFIQIRGSIPFYWDQKNVSREVNFTQNDDINQSTMLKHFKMLREQFHFKEILILNLLSKKKKNERKLGVRLHHHYLDNFTNNKIEPNTIPEVSTPNQNYNRSESIENSMNVDWLDMLDQNTNGHKQSNCIYIF